MKKCDFCSQSTPDGKCKFELQSSRERHCEKAIKLMCKALKEKKGVSQPLKSDMRNKQKLALMSGLTEMDFKWLGIKSNFESMKIHNFYYNQSYGVFMPNFKWK